MQPRTERAPTGRERTVPAWVKVLVFFHLFCITVWALPKPPDPVFEGKRPPVGPEWILVGNQNYLKPFQPIQVYLFTTGAWQYWDMFAPNPSRTDFYCDAEVRYKDGTMRVYQYPRMYDLPIPMKYLKERYRKFYERAHDDQYPYLFGQFAYAIARLNYDDRNNPPVSVFLYRHWKDTGDPGKPYTGPYGKYCYFRYAVEENRLRNDKYGDVPASSTAGAAVNTP